jgi:hypothetical protein
VNDSSPHSSKRSVRYLKIIAVFKILQGALLLIVGGSLIFLNSRTRWLDGIAEWASDELALVHSRPTHFLLGQLQQVVAGGRLRVTGFFSLFYAAILCTEGIGVYLQKRWAEKLMVFATGALIPFEIHHLWRQPGAVAAIILAANCFIVGFLYFVLREKGGKPESAEIEVAAVR